jgi:hypothetical protein
LPAEIVSPLPPGECGRVGFACWLGRPLSPEEVLPLVNSMPDLGLADIGGADRGAAPSCSRESVRKIGCRRASAW